MSGKVFERGGKLVSLGSFRGRLPQAYRAATAGIPQARAALCTSSSIACVLARHADIEIWNTIKSNYGPGLVPEHITAALLDWPSYESIPHLAGVVEVPTIDHEGRVIDTPGFDEATCLWYAPRDHHDHAAEPLTVGTTHADAKAACATLLDFVGQFPFVADHDRAAWLSYALTIAGRPAIQGPVPAFTFAAPSKRTGKTFLTEIGSIIGTGHSAADARLSDSSDEGGKHLTALMLQAARVVRFDNLKKGRAFEYPPIESTLTTGVWSGRLLGKSIVITGEWHAVIVATGVDLTVGLEMSGRCIPCVLDSGMEHPEDRVGFLESNIVAAALRDQRKLLSAALTILRAHALAGRPTPIAATKNPWGDYAAWQSVVRDAVLWAYGHDPIGGRVALRERVNENDKETALLKAFAAFQTVRGGSAIKGGPAWWTVADVHTACSYSKDVPPRDEYRELRAALSIATRFKGDGSPSRQSIAGVLSSLIKAPRAGLVLCRDKDAVDGHKGGAEYRVEETRAGDFVPESPKT
jgi:putative DNA primase/helicase